MRTPFLVLALLVAAPIAAAPQERVPGEHWICYSDPAEAGFDTGALEAAHETWEKLPSSAFLVIANGAVVAGWGDLERRFMCHSMRKSFLSALYGIYWDRGQIELNKTLADLGLDDEPEPLLESEKRARIIDLLQARSGRLLSRRLRRPDLALLELGTLVFPRSANAWVNLAEAHMSLGHMAEAREFYQSSLQLDAGNENARAKLAELETGAGMER